MPWGKVPWDREMRFEKAQDAAGSFRFWQVWRGRMGRGTDFEPFPGTSSIGMGFECGSLGEEFIPGGRNREGWPLSEGRFRWV